MMKNIYKILPYFMVEYLAIKYCEVFEARDGYISVNVFKNTVITTKL